MTKCYSHFLPLTQIAAATFAQSWATFTKNILENKVTNLSAFWFIGNLTFCRKICWSTSQYDFIAILKNNFPFDTDIKNLGPYLFILKSEIWTLSFFASNQKKILSLKSMYCQSIFFFTKKIIFRLINPDWEIKREKFNVL